MHWDKLDKGLRGESFHRLVLRVRQLPEQTIVRYGDVGDLPGRGSHIDAAQLTKLSIALLWTTAWAYTHKPLLTSKRNVEILRSMRGGPLVINMSAEGWTRADKLLDLDAGPVTTVLPKGVMPADWRKSQTRNGVQIVRCPAEYSDVQCKTCGGGQPLCARWDREWIVGFTTHGCGWKRADQMIAEVEMGLL